MKKILLLLGIVAGLQFQSRAQETKSDFGIRFQGFIKNDVFYNTRQTVSAREGHFMLWPAPQSPDSRGDDVNAHHSFNILAIQSRLSGTITGPDALGASTSGKIEGDFFAQANDNINLFRLRHAYLQLEWENTRLLFGQYWNPFFIPACYPATVSFNSGSPIQPFARNPQVRLAHTMGPFQVIAAAVGQRDYTSRGPAGATSEYLRNSGMPEFHLQAHVTSRRIAAGAGLAHKRIVPRTETQTGLKTDRAVSGLSAIAFAKLRLPGITIKMEAVRGQNNPDVLNISGYAVSSIEAATDYRNYTPMRNMSLWTDIHTNGDRFQAGLFAGYTENLGTNESISDQEIIYGFGSNVAHLYRLSPRLVYNSGRLRFGLEGEYTSATFGSEYNDHAVPVDTHTVENLRILFSSYFFF
ncbi:MAG TPA: hypothetical protein VJ876_02255 [Bacteroidales bacterium]|nr:hypothetical protein [Bacteroidales bacterium]